MWPKQDWQKKTRGALPRSGQGIPSLTWNGGQTRDILQVPIRGRVRTGRVSPPQFIPDHLFIYMSRSRSLTVLLSLSSALSHSSLFPLVSLSLSLACSHSLACSCCLALSRGMGPRGDPFPQQGIPASIPAYKMVRIGARMEVNALVGAGSGNPYPPRPCCQPQVKASITQLVYERISDQNVLQSYSINY